MPWCPDCRTEYREGFENCSDCGARLVGQLPVESPAEVESEQSNSAEAFLISVADGMQADILESKLKFYGVPVRRKYKESGDYLTVYMGATPFGIDLYVPQELLEQASELISLATEPLMDDANQNEAEEDVGYEEQKQINTVRRNRSRFLVFWLLFLPLVLLLIIELIKNIME